MDGEKGAANCCEGLGRFFGVGGLNSALNDELGFVDKGDGLPSPPQESK